MADFPGIPGYRFGSVLGQGGVGKVYLAIQEELGRKVAVKVLESSLLKNNFLAWHLFFNHIFFKRIIIWDSILYFSPNWRILVILLEKIFPTLYNYIR